MITLPATAAPELPLNALDLAFARYLQHSQPSCDPRHAWLAGLTSHQFGRGHACLDLDWLQQDSAQALGWDTRACALLPPELGPAAPSLPWIAGPNSPLVLDGTRLYLRRNWAAEQAIRAAIETRLAQPCPLPPQLQGALARLFPGDPLAAQPDWQQLACALAARRRFTLITGGPGTGKTTTVVRLLALLQSDRARADTPLRVALAAPTGKAAARLGESISSALRQLPPDLQAHIPTQAQTLHKLLQVRHSAALDPVPELALDLVVVDEASMIDLEMMARLLAAVPLNASLILLGDKDQLASVEAGAVMGQLCAQAERGDYNPATRAWLAQTCGADLSPWAGAGSALAQQTVMLRHSRRFAEHSAIGQWARAVNAGDQPALRQLWQQTPPWSEAGSAEVSRLDSSSGAEALLALARHGWRDWLRLLHQGPSDAWSDAQALAALQALARFQVLCALREGPAGVQALNQRLASGLGFEPSGWYAGRPVLLTRNDYALQLMNGDIGLCLPQADGLRVAFPDGQGGVRWVRPNRLEAVESVFAMTVHKSQGSEFEHVALVLPPRALPVLTRELLYTGLTRARAQLTLVVPDAALLAHAARTRVLRSGGLSALCATPLVGGSDANPPADTTIP